MKKIISIFILLLSSYVSAITSTLNHRTIATSPLLYSMIDYSKQQLSIEAAPFFLSMYDTQHTIANLIPDSKSTLIFDQQGNGDVNPAWLNLLSNNNLANYNSMVTFTPQLSQGGMLLHGYTEHEHYYIDLRTALLECSTQIMIEEQNGGNGLNPGILNVVQAFTQPSWNYGKIGDSNQIAGLDNIQLKVGGKMQTTAETFDVFLTGFGLVEIPTGRGTTAEWLFEPQIGTNHWGLGFGGQTMVHSDANLKLLIGGDYRYFLPASEIRSFDLLHNGQWSRYIGIQDMYGLSSAPLTDPLPGINFLTQSAKIEGRNQINLYTRLEKTLGQCAFELGYNFFYSQAETIGAIQNIIPNYGLYVMNGSAGGSGGVTTSSTATINESLTTLDPTPVALTTAMFDKSSAAAQSFSTNTLTARIQRVEATYNYGIGASIEVAQSAGALSSWAVWAKFEYLFSHE